MNILYISYDGAMDLLGASQIIPYLIGLSKKGVKFTLLTFEKKEKLRDINRVHSLKKMLEGKNIKWEFLIYHKRPAIPATVFDIISGLIKGAAIVLRDKIELIHARSFIGAIPALLLVKSLNLKFIFDMRGFWPDERVDGSIWRRKGFLYRFTKWWEKIFLLKANWVVCLTEEAKKIIEDSSCLKKKRINIDVISTCTDTVKFKIREKDKNLLGRLNLQDRLVFIYFGSLGTWYMIDEILDFFKIVKRISTNSFFICLTPDKYLVTNKMTKKQVNRKDYFIDYISYEEIPYWISLADASVSFIKPVYSKKSSCPTKFAESLACGIPVVINSGIGDTEKFVRNYNIGVIAESFTEEGYLKAANQLLKILEDRDFLRKNCRKVAENFFSLENGLEKYWAIYQKLKYI